MDTMRITEIAKTINNQPVIEVVIESDKYKVVLISLGAAIKRFLTPDTQGEFENITLSYDDERDYLENPKFLGATIGPYAGRIYPPSLRVNHKMYSLESNFMDHANLHSGSDNIMLHNFTSTIEDEAVIFTTVQKETSSHFPSDMNFEVRYEFNEHGFDIIFNVESDQVAVANLTNHTHFNLSGDAKRTVLEHTLEIPAEQYIHLDAKFIGESIKSVEKTPFDFRTEKPLKKGIAPLKSTPQKGIDHPFVLQDGTITLKDYVSGRYLQVKTNYDALVVYTNNFLTDKLLEPSIKDIDHLSVCLEAQHIPNDVHFLDNATSFMKPNSKKQNIITYRVGNLPLYRQ